MTDRANEKGKRTMDEQIGKYLDVVNARKAALAAGDTETYAALRKSFRARRSALNQAYHKRITLIQTSQNMRERAKATKESTRIAQALKQGM